MNSLLDNPYKMNMLLNGIGLLGSKYEDQAARYQQGLSAGLLDQAKWRQGAAERKLKDEYMRSQIGLNDAKQATELNPMLFQGSSQSANIGNILSKYSAILKNGGDLTPQQSAGYNYAYQTASQPKITTLPDGRTIQVPPIDMGGFALPPGVAIPSSVAPHSVTTGPQVIDEVDPFKKNDADRVIAAQDDAAKFKDMMNIFDAIDQDMALYPTGITSGIEKKARQIGSVVGIGDKKTLAAGERLDFNFNKLTSENMKFLVGAMSEGERQFTKEFTPGMLVSVQGNKAYMGFLRGVAGRAKKYAPMMRDYYRKHKNSLDGWDAQWQKYIDTNPVNIPDINNIDPDQPGNIKPGNSYDPATGKWY